MTQNTKIKIMKIAVPGITGTAIFLLQFYNDEVSAFLDIIVAALFLQGIYHNICRIAIPVRKELGKTPWVYISNSLQNLALFGFIARDFVFKSARVFPELYPDGFADSFVPLAGYILAPLAALMIWNLVIHPDRGAGI